MVNIGAVYFNFNSSVDILYLFIDLNLIDKKIKDINLPFNKEFFQLTILAIQVRLSHFICSFFFFFFYMNNLNRSHRGHTIDKLLMYLFLQVLGKRWFEKFYEINYNPVNNKVFYFSTIISRHLSKNLKNRSVSINKAKGVEGIVPDCSDQGYRGDSVGLFRSRV